MAVLCISAGPARAATTLAGPFDDSGATYTKVTNGGVENGSGTDANTWNEWSRSIFGRSSAYHYKGSYSAAINDLTWTGAGGGKAITQSVTVTAGGSYVLSGYIYHPGGSGNAYLDLADQSYTQLDGGSGDCTAGAVKGWPEWQFVYCPFKVGGSTTSVTVRMVVDATWSGSPAAFDEVAITPLASFVPPVSLDKDKDGYTAAEGDCDDTVATTHPGAADAWYDGVDSDCDGADDHDQDGDGYTTLGAPTGTADDCDDTVATTHPEAADAWYDGVDSDCDGADDHDQDADGYTALGAPTGTADDCDDTASAVNPGATETWYDGVDADCDGNDFDQDGDGYTTLGAPTGTADDCDDTASAVNPGATETWYDGVDADCDGADDYDQDADGYTALGAPTGTADDCDDTVATTHPEAADAWYDGVDSDCDGADDHDQDADGYTTLGAPTGTADDCDDTASAVNPGAAETWYDGVDADCDGADDHDQDADGYTALGAPTGTADDCDDTAAAVNPGATETWYDGVDADCDGADDHDQDADGHTALGAPTGSADDCDDADPAVDVAGTWYPDDDDDGYGSDAATTACEAPADHVDVTGDCDDAAADVFPGATETCDGVDEDCDGVVDDGLPTSLWYQDLDVDGYGDDGVFVDVCDGPSGWIAVGGDCDDGDEAIHPDAPEACDGVDQDCDGLVDDGLTLGTYYGDADEDGYGDAEAAVEACVAPSGTVEDATDCDDGDALVHPGAAELCNGFDDDCDDAVDEDVVEQTWHADADGDGFGDPADAVDDCDEPEGRVLDGSDCDDADPDVHPEADEVANDGIDQDCDGADLTPGSTRSWEADTGGDTEPPGAGCGCAGAPGGGALGWVAAMSAALALVRRRRPA